MLCESNICLVEEDILNQFDEIEKHGWKASNYSEYWGRKYDESIVHRLGTLQNQVKQQNCDLRSQCINNITHLL